MEPTERFESEPTMFPSNARTDSARKEGFRPVADRESYVDVPGMLVLFDRQSPVLHIVESLLYSGTQPPDSIQPLFSAIANPHARYWHESVVATWALGRMELNAQERDAAAVMLLEILKNNSARTVGQSIWLGLNWSFWSMLAVSFLWMVIDASGEFPLAEVVVNLTLLASFVLVPIAIATGGTLSKHCEAQRAAAAETLGRLKAVSAIHPLAENFEDENVKVREASALALRHILPTLTYEDYGKFDSPTIHSLGRLLSSSDVMLAFTVLEALEKIGTGAAIPYVSRVVKSGASPLLRDTARRVLTVLEERKRSKAYAEQLGRPSSSTPDPADELLRPNSAEDSNGNAS